LRHGAGLTCENAGAGSSTVCSERATDLQTTRVPTLRFYNLRKNAQNKSQQMGRPCMAKQRTTCGWRVCQRQADEGNRGCAHDESSFGKVM
jgi:hypothetical protein